MIQGMTLLFSLDQDCEQFVCQVSKQLNSSGLQVVRSFDLQVARMSHLGYACPHHGADACTCQLIVLLVYDRDNLPTTLMFHGSDGHTWVFLVNHPEQRVDARQETSVLHTISPANFSLVSQGEAAGIV
ncbi:MAG TPA: hypothetical protein VF498_08700 [Anaerolineales bacterium]